ncbi:hypothetical protein BS78_07G205300 [Paspalum vaginatum]|nr:hypothetical protein BS78_07G205300 [Paspalum vaginatum]
MVSTQSRCAVKLLTEVVRRMNSSKTQLVKSTGFGGLLKFPDRIQVNNKLIVWLMRRIDVSSRTLVISNYKQIPFHKTDASRIFGISSGTKKVVDRGLLNKDIKQHLMLSCFGSTKWEDRTIRNAQEVIERDYTMPMTKAEKDTFKIAFVVFAMSTILAPGSRHGYASVDYWNALAEPEDIEKHDWAHYVIERLLDGVVKLKSDLNCKIKTPKVIGCALLLQVLYLDSIDTGPWNIQHNVFPRISCFTIERMKGMILYDTKAGSNSSSTDMEFGHCRLRQPSEVCYHWATTYHNTSSWSTTNSQRALWEASMLMSKVLNTPPQAAAPLFAAMADFQSQMNPQLGVQFMKLVSVLMSILYTYKTGFNYNFTDSEVTTVNRKGLPPFHQNMSCCYEEDRFSIHNSPLTTDDAAGNSCNIYQSVHTIIGNSTDQEVEDMINKAIAKTCLVLRQLKYMPKGTTLHRMRTVRQSGEGCNDDVIGPNSIPKSPWALQHKGTEDIVVQAEALPVLDKIDGSTPSSMTCIMHYHPRFIQVSGHALRAQFVGECEMELDLFDAIIRRFKQKDDMLYNGSGNGIWCHYFESDILTSMLAGKLDVNDPGMRRQFDKADIGYNITNTQLFIIPGFLHNRWVCFTWRMWDNTIVVFDPAYMDGDNTTKRLHLHIVSKLKDAMHTIVNTLVGQWDFNWSAAGIIEYISVAPNPAAHHFNRLNHTGILCANFCAAFDGYKIQGTSNRETFTEMSARLFADLMKLSGNNGKAAKYQSRLHEYPPTIHITI